MTGTIIATIVSLLVVCFAASAAGKPDLPPEEKSIRNDVDHWGLAFSDQLTAFRVGFREFAKLTKVESPDYVLGVETSLRKTFRSKYWFKGDVTNVAELTAGRNESEAFQLAVIPRIGFDLNDVQISASALRLIDGKARIPASAVRLWRVGFVKTHRAQYPTRHVGLWPDPLLPLERFSLSGLDLGLIWCEIKVPRDAPAGDYRGTITVRASNSRKTTLAVKLHVWNFILPDRVPLPTIVWIKGKMDSKEYRDVCGLFLDHHLDPVSVGATNDLKLLNRNLEYCFKRGLMFFQTPGFKKPDEFRRYYRHIKKKGWLDKALMYGAHDEPTEKQFRDLVVPKTAEIRKEFPGVKVFLATEHHRDLHKGTDIWLTDVSTNFHTWLNAGRPGKQQLWWYFCHLPVRVGMERSLVDAPNMLIDNDAIEHRLPYWMVRHYGVKGVFIWAGNRSWPDAYKLTKKKAGFPYAGIHNGNGFLVYPGPIPTIRLKVLRDGIEDYWYIARVAELAADGPRKKEAQELLDGIVPGVFVDTHYFTREPARILEYRKKLGDFIEKAP